MKNFNKYIVIFFFSFFSFTPLVGNEKTAVIDIDFLIKNSNIGQKVLKNIDELNKKNINQLKKKNESLKKLEIEIKNKKNIISEEDFNSEVKNLRQKVQDFTSEKDKIVKVFNDFRKEEIEKLFKLFNPIISNYMKENSINILLDTKDIFMIDKASNLTDEILKLINDQIK